MGMPTCHNVFLNESIQKQQKTPPNRSIPEYWIIYIVKGVKNKILIVSASTYNVGIHIDYLNGKINKYVMKLYKPTLKGRKGKLFYFILFQKKNHRLKGQAPSTHQRSWIRLPNFLAQKNKNSLYLGQTGIVVVLGTDGRSEIADYLIAKMPILTSILSGIKVTENFWHIYIEKVNICASEL